MWNFNSLNLVMELIIKHRASYSPMRRMVTYTKMTQVHNTNKRESNNSSWLVLVRKVLATCLQHMKKEITSSLFIMTRLIKTCCHRKTTRPTTRSRQEGWTSLRIYHKKSRWIMCLELIRFQRASKRIKE